MAVLERQVQGGDEHCKLDLVPSQRRAVMVFEGQPEKGGIP
jgi:hypothetical protein